MNRICTLSHAATAAPVAALVHLNVTIGGGPSGVDDVGASAPE
jgi:hypothetical protein